MKSNSDNFRESSILDVIKKLSTKGMGILIYEPVIKESTFQQYAVIADLKEFKNRSDLIITNRLSDELNDVKQKVYCRDLYLRD